jgi:hypothetical protein
MIDESLGLFYGYHWQGFTGIQWKPDDYPALDLPDQRGHLGTLGDPAGSKISDERRADLLPSRSSKIIAHGLTPHALTPP